MRASRHNYDHAVRWAAVAAVALTALCGLIGAHTLPANAQDAPELGDPPAENSQPAGPGGDPLPSPSRPPPGPLKIMSWNVASSPYAIAMRKIKSSAPAWRTSFGSERRTIDAPPPPRAAMIDADVVLLQGITNPRALRRLFPARSWRLIFSRRALETLPKGSVFTAPVSSVEVEAIAIRFRDGLRVVNRGEDIDDLPSATPELATPASIAAPAATAVQPPVNPASPGLVVKVIDRGRTLWLASVVLDNACVTPGDAGCAKSALLERWRARRKDDGEQVVTGGRMHPDAPATACTPQGITWQAASPNGPPRLAKGENRQVLGCIAELTLE
ncbi:MAG: hypothetical protein Q7T86_15830 [Hyphomicrobiaceae bacterium]|nr:hypothetical protein [Hyphomicrobiaceae bacterium]